MNKQTLTNHAFRVVLALACAVAAPAAIAASTWGFKSIGSGGNCVQTTTGVADNRGNSWSCADTTGGGPTATVTAWAGNSSLNFAKAEVAQYTSSGFGVRNTVSGGNDYAPDQHSMDNDGLTDLLLFYFGGVQVSLDTVKMGWWTNDSDFSLLAYTGAGTPTPAAMAGLLPNYDTAGTGDGITTATSSASGWSHVGDFMNAATNTTAVTQNPKVYSSWWIVSAYDQGYNNTSYTNGNDYLKLQALTGHIKPPSNGAPEPGSLALVGMACLGLLYARRRRQRQD